MNGKEAKQARPPLQDRSLPSVASSSGVGGLCPLSCSLKGSCPTSRTANGLVHAQKCPAGSHSAQVTSSGAAPSLRKAPHPFPLLLASGRWRTAATQSRAGRPVTHPSPTPQAAACTTEEITPTSSEGCFPYHTLSLRPLLGQI